MNEKQIITTAGGNKNSRDRVRMMRDLLLVSSTVSSNYSLDLISELNRKTRYTKRLNNCNTCIVKKDNPSYCKKCKEMED